MSRRNGGPYVAPTDKMMSYMLSLARERVMPEYGADANERVQFLTREVEERRLSRYGAMDVIDRLKTAPRDLSAAEANQALQPGVYLRNGEVFVVKLNRSKTALYAKRLVEIGGRRLTESDDRVHVDFEYAPGAIRNLRPGDHMSLEDARPYLIRYSNCMVCGRPLKDATSVELSIGPVCRKMFRSTAYETEPRPAPDSGDAVEEILDMLDNPPRVADLIEADRRDARVAQATNDRLAALLHQLQGR